MRNKLWPKVLATTITAILATLVILSTVFPLPANISGSGILSIGTSQIVQASPDWLLGWDQRVKLTADASDIDADVTHFPVLLHISTSCGRNSEDVSFVFDELQSDANRFKIAVTKADGTTQLYGEIESWDDANEEAWLWVSKSDWMIDDTTNTDFYLYYDADHADNTAYISDGNTNVWDSSFTGVYHLNRLDWNDYKEASGVLTPTTEYNAGYSYQETSTLYEDSKFKYWILHGSGGTLEIHYWTSTDGLSLTHQNVAEDSDTYAHFQVMKPTDGKLPLEAAIADDGGLQTTETTEANDSTANDMTLLPATPAVDDAYYFGGVNRFNSFLVNVGTVGVGTWTITWEYYNGSWTSLSGVSDGTSGFTVSGSNEVTYTLPTDWAETTVNSITSYWIRARVSSYTSISTQPKGTQAWLRFSYWLYACDWGDSAQDFDLLVSANETNFELHTEAVIECGGSGWDSTYLGNIFVWQESASDWRCIYEGYQSGYAWKMGYATGTDGWSDWSKDAGNPIEIDGFGDSGDVYGGPFIKKVDSTYYMSFHGNPAGGTPSDCYWAKSTSLTSFTCLNGPGVTIFKRTLSWENPAGSASQVADWEIVEYNNKCYIYYEGLYDQTPASGQEWIIGCIVIPKTLEGLILSATDSDYAGSVTTAPHGIFDSTSAVPADTSSGEIDGAEDYDGSSDGTNLGDNFDAGAGDQTVELRFKTTDSAATQMLIDKRNDGDSPIVWPIHLRLDTNQDVEYYTRYDAETDLLEKTGSYCDGAFHYIAAVRDADVGKLLYVDDASAETNSGNTADDLENSEDIYIAQFPTGSDYFDGIVDEVRFSDCVRTAAWVKASYETGRDDLLDWGSEEGFIVEITNTPSSNDFGILEVNTTSSTAINYFTIENTGTCTVDVVIYGTDATGGDDTWTLSDTATPGENIYGLYAGLDDADDNFDVIVKKTETYNTLVSNLAEDATQDWGLKIYMPTALSGYDAQQMSATITLVASESS